MESCPINVECVLGDEHDGPCMDAEHFEEFTTRVAAVVPEDMLFQAPVAAPAPSPQFSLQDLLGAVSQLIDQKLAPVIAKVNAAPSPQAQAVPAHIAQEAAAQDPAMGRAGRFARRVSLPTGPAQESNEATAYWGKPITGLPHQRGE